MKRFWTAAAAVKVPAGWGVELDGKALNTPAKAPLAVPTRALGEAIAAEWQDAGEDCDPRAMPMTGLANAAIDRVAPDPVSFAAGLAAYGESDLICYRAEGPRELVTRQAQAWDPLIAWARRRFDIDLATACGVIHVPQDDGAIRQLRHAVAALDPFRLAGLSPLVTIGGSLIAALALLEGAIEADQAWDAVSLDDAWQLSQWGSDSEAEQRLANRKAEFLAGLRFLSLLDG